MSIFYQKLLQLTVVFGAFLLSAKLGQMVFFSLHTSPALFWPPIGIALGLMVMWGYGMWPAVALAALVASLTNGAPIPSALASTLGNTAQTLVGVYFLYELGFDPSMRRARDAFSLIFVATVGTVLLPSITTGVQVLTNTLNVNEGAYFVWTRLWAGEIMSILVITPVITTWMSKRHYEVPRALKFETALAFTTLLALTFYLFWTHSNWTAVYLYAYLATFVWFGVRMSMRVISLGLLLTSVVAIAGTVLVPGPTPLSQQLLADELFIELVAVIFLIFGAIVEERREATRDLVRNVVQLENALEKIQAQDEAKSEFIAILAHELRNPLSPVLSSLEFLKLKPRDTEVTEALGVMETQVHTMARLLDDLLDIARVSQKRFSLKKQTVQLQSLIGQAIESTRALIISRGHTLQVVIPPTPLWILVDPLRFEQIVVNLLNNAAKYTDPGGQIEVICSTTEKNLEVIVKDNGIGIAPEECKHIFEPFKRISSNNRTGGLGIGLSLTKQLVEMHGGTVRCESLGLGEGSTFVVRLPLEEHLTIPAIHESPLLRREPLRVLVVDDNEAAAHGLSKLLQFKGHEVYTAYTGTEAIDAVKRLKPQVIVLDIGLPDIDGYEVARQLRTEIKAPATLIALTGYGQQEDKIKALSAGFDHHLTKPVGFSEIEKLLVNINVLK